MSGGHSHHVDPGELVPLEAHRRDVLSRIEALDPIELSLLEAHGCVLAEDIVAEAPVPGFANSAMDGWAIQASDAHAGAELAIVGEVAAGEGKLPAVGPGEAVRIMTGGAIPPGSETVVPLEVAEEHEGRVRIAVDAAADANIRPAGEDVAAGDRVLETRRRLRAGDVGMLAAIGRSRVLVHPRPRVAVISTGDELAAPGRPLSPGQVRDANSYTLTAAARETGALAFRHDVVPDDRHALTEAFEGALVHSDVVVTSGGVSAGRYDLVKQVLRQLGDVAFHKVGMQPGMPQAFGFLGTVPCFGLPGNPVSAFVSFEIFVRPALRRMQGRTDLNRPRVSAVLEEPVRSPEHKVSFLRVRLRRDDAVWHARPTGAQGSGILRSVVDADGLAEVPADRTTLEPGERITVHLLVEP